MDSRPRYTKAHGRIAAEKLAALGWTLVREFRESPDGEPYEYLFLWEKPGEPPESTHQKP
jgi:hypothetical protein